MASLSDQIIGVESGGRNIGNPRSSAYGPGQFLNGTWLSMMKKYRPDITQGRSDQDILAMRNDAGLNRQMTDAYAGENGAALKRAGFDQTPGNLYLAHFAGPGGALKVLGAPNASAADTLGPAVVAANPFLAKMTNADLQAWADRKMTGQRIAGDAGNLGAAGLAGVSPGMNGLSALVSPARAMGLMPALAPTPALAGDRQAAPQPAPQAPGMPPPINIAGGQVAPTLPLFSPQQPSTAGQAPAQAQAPQSFWSMLAPPSDPTALANFWARQNPTG